MLPCALGTALLGKDLTETTCPPSDARYSGAELKPGRRGHLNRVSYSLTCSTDNGTYRAVSARTRRPRRRRRRGCRRRRGRGCSLARGRRRRGCRRAGSTGSSTSGTSLTGLRSRPLLVHLDICLIATIRCIRISAVILRILSGVVGGRRRGVSRCGRRGRRAGSGRRRVAVAVAVILVMVVSVVALVRVAASPAAISTTTTTTAAATAAAASAVAAGWTVLELFVLLFHIAKQVLAKFFGLYNHVRVGAPKHCQQNPEQLIHTPFTYATCKNMSSSLSRPVATSM
jgi:hypothetical protein